ncbi:MAG TPA: glycosyltransferase [Actinomycetota bacterium]|nr:glycosyltransferase [Actinomycetota bacterium]HNL50364.1 glycosyltransferase [Actinomycetota bacterium]HNO14629.1 glycosyltransferase [Actinomycetota bacterium]HUM85790.1 glycosyltransferase [Actinomycetota bacterium]
MIERIDPGCVAVVVTTFEPPEQVRDLFTVLSRWSGPIIVVDDGSVAPMDPGPWAQWIRCDQNRGVAAALNAGLRAARHVGATHVVTFDQDSVLDEQFLPDLVAAWGRASERGFVPGVVAPRDPGPVRYRGTEGRGFLSTTEVIQSGAMFSLAQLAEIGDFDERLVIDSVDSQACLRLGERGYNIVCLDLPMGHRIGDAIEFAVGSRRVLLTRHPPQRHYYMTRNRILLAREHVRRRPGWAAATLRKTAVGAVLTVMFDEDRRGKAAAIFRGVRDGLRGRIRQ